MSPRVPRFLVLAALCATTVHAQAAPARASIDPARWLTGCWTRVDARGETVERWHPPEGPNMFGMSRTMRNDSLRGYEFLLLSASRPTLAYIAHLPGQMPTVFLASTVSDTLLVFENPRHDFPQEVRYRRVGTDSVEASIAGVRDGQRREVPMPFRRTPCREWR